MTGIRDRRGAGALRALAALAILATGLAAPAAELRPHRALYDLDLAAVRGGSEIVALRGRMALEWADACEGWTVSQNIRMAIANRDGSSFVNDIGFSSFETRSGDRFRYSSRWLDGGARVREFVGRAEVGPGGGRAVFTVPEDGAIELPEGTVFPTEHLFLLVDAAAAGESPMTRTVFGGTGPDSLHDITAFIGGENPGGSGFDALAGLRSWPVSAAWFPAGSPAAEPDFEVSYRLAENGVASELVLDYGDFAMNAALAELEFLPPPEC